MNDPTPSADMTPETTPVDPPRSIMEHVEAFSPEARQARAAEEPIPADETPAQQAEREQRRDDGGKFKSGFKRHRAKSHEATPDDVEKIGEYTRRIKTVEESIADITKQEGESQRAFELRRRAELIERIAQAKEEPAKEVPKASPPPSFPATPAFPDDPEPQDSDPKYESNYPQYLRDVASWEGRQQFRRLVADQQRQAMLQHRHARLQENFGKAKAKYADFEQVAFTPVPWQSGSLVDNFIHEDDAGGEVLYYLQSHPTERDSLGAMTEFQATKFLTQLSLRLLSNGSEAAGTNGAAPRPVEVKLPPKPPTPLRTEAQRVSEPPPTDGSLSILQHRKKFSVR